MFTYVCSFAVACLWLSVALDCSPAAWAHLLTADCAGCWSFRSRLLSISSAHACALTAAACARLQGEFLFNVLQNQKSIVNAMAVNEDGVMATGGDNGSLW